MDRLDLVPLGESAPTNRAQTTVAARMGTSQSAVARLESAELDAKLSTIERYAVAIGQRVEFRVAEDRSHRRKSA